ncbi:response regulator [Azospirillum agricola]|uniref:response regulator n=1 Tax=Azospirillum agricola TaxID=1720247 RepID=UPI000A0EF2F6|nr:response regulator [Azospirillum agricola]SMH60579.1 CheY chemotaxis protein or a CheY-like REC (receiver) domain [Azospirillum lipoferum]
MPLRKAKLTILIVENEAILRMTTSELLEAWGHETVLAGSADEAIALVEAGARPDFALLDILLGAGPDGIALASILRKRWDILSIFVSANLQGEPLNQAIRTGPLHILKKPFTEMDLRRMLSYARETLTDEPCDVDPGNIWLKPDRGEAVL